MSKKPKKSSDELNQIKDNDKDKSNLEAMFTRLIGESTKSFNLCLVGAVGAIEQKLAIRLDVNDKEIHDLHVRIDTVEKRVHELNTEND